MDSAMLGTGQMPVASPSCTVPVYGVTEYCYWGLCPGTRLLPESLVCTVSCTNFTRSVSYLFFFLFWYFLSYILFLFVCFSFFVLLLLLLWSYVIFGSKSLLKNGSNINVIIISLKKRRELSSNLNDFTLLYKDSAYVGMFRNRLI